MVHNQRRRSELLLSKKIMHDSSMKEMISFRDKYLSNMEGCSILDVGSRNVKPDQQDSYVDIFKGKFNYVGMDVEPGNNVDIVGYEALRGRSFDVVISGQCMEHVNHPWDWLSNLAALYSKYICIIAPHSFKEHRFPIDTYRYFPDGMRDLFDYAKIKEIEIFRNKTDTIGIGTKH